MFKHASPMFKFKQFKTLRWGSQVETLDAHDGYTECEGAHLSAAVIATVVALADAACRWIDGSK